MLRLPDRGIGVPCDPSLPAGAAVAYFRDDAARLDAPDAPPNGELVVPGTIAARAYPGGHYRYRVKVGSGEVSVDDADHHPVGAEVGVRLAPQRLHIFSRAEVAR